jgi:hypothetical protein
MSLSMYQASIPALVQMLNNLSAILDKAEAHAQDRKIEPEVLFNYRLAPDMLPLIRQVQIAADLAREPPRGSQVSIAALTFNGLEAENPPFRATPLREHFGQYFCR